jgi:DeoR family glycerol-3-phosphate regulon repressor
VDQLPGRAAPRRLQEILGIAREAGRVSVEELAARFAVTPQTIRRDLNERCDSRRLTRVHGGAMLPSGVENLAYDDRKLVSQPHKRLIGEAAARLVADNSSLFIDLGTTTEEVARALSSHSGLLVITNNLQVAAGLHRHRGIEVILVTDGSKFMRSAPVRIAHLSEVDVLVTDRLPSRELAALRGAWRGGCGGGRPGGAG